MNTEETLRDQLLVDVDRLHLLIIRYATGDRAVKAERDRLTEVVEKRITLLGRSHAIARNYTQARQFGVEVSLYSMMTLYHHTNTDVMGFQIDAGQRLESRWHTHCKLDRVRS